jgi:hypothetical protein
MTQALLVAIVAPLALCGLQTWRLDHAQAQALTEHLVAEKSRAEAESAARQKEAQYAANVQQASQIYSVNVAKAHAAAAGAVADLDGLRNALAAAGSAAADPLATSRTDDAARARLVFGECASALQKVAAAADECETRLTGLQGYVLAIQAKP